MKRFDFYFKQKVTEGELDGAFASAEQAEWDIVTDFGFTGVIANAVVTEHIPVPDLTVDVSGPAKARSNAGERLFFASGQNADISVDEGGSPTTVGTPGNEKYVALFLEFDRIVSDPRTDGNGATVFFVRDESFRFRVIQGAEAAIGFAVRPAKSLAPTAILLSDIRLINGQTQIFNADIFTDRRDDVEFTSAAFIGVDDNFPNLGSPGFDNVQEVLEAIDDHVGDTEDPHGAQMTITDALRVGTAVTAFGTNSVIVSNGLFRWESSDVVDPSQLLAIFTGVAAPYYTFRAPGVSPLNDVHVLQLTNGGILEAQGGLGGTLSGFGNRARVRVDDAAEHVHIHSGFVSAPSYSVDLHVGRITMEGTPAGGEIEFSDGQLTFLGGVGTFDGGTGLLTMATGSITLGDVASSLSGTGFVSLTGDIVSTLGKVQGVYIRPTESHRGLALSATQFDAIGKGRWLMAGAAVDADAVTPGLRPGSVNVASITRVSAGVYDVNFINAFSNNEYMVSGGLSESSVVGHISFGKAATSHRSTTKLRVHTFNQGGSATDLDFDVTIFGEA